MPRAPTLEKTIDTLITLLFHDQRITPDDLKLIIPLVKSMVDIIEEAVHRN